MVSARPRKVHVIAAAGAALHATTGPAVFYGVEELLRAVAPGVPEPCLADDDATRRRRRSLILAALAPHLEVVDYQVIAEAFAKGEVTGLQALSALGEGTLSWVVIGRMTVLDTQD